MKTLIRAPWGVIGQGVMWRDVGVCVEEGRIVAWGSADDFCDGDFDRCVKLSGCVLSPGWINAHAHLDYGFLRGKLRGENFVKWIQEVVKAKASVCEQEIVDSMEQGAKEAFWSGCTTMVAVSSFPQWIAKADVGALRMVWAVEWLDAGDALRELRVREAMEDWMRCARENDRWGISPHAPYSTSIELYKGCRRWAEACDGLFTTHVGESEAEWLLFQNGKGDFTDWFAERGIKGVARKGMSPFQYLVECGALPQSALCVHGNYMTDEDLDVVAKQRMGMVHCPRCHDFFGHRAFDWDAYRRRGITVCIGTDSLGSTPSLDLRGELRWLRDRDLNFNEVELWRMVTVEAAQVVGMARSRSVIDLGADADLVAFPLREEENPWSFVFEEDLKIEWIMTRGQIYEKSIDDEKSGFN